MNAYPTAGSLVSCTASGGKLEIQGINGKSLELATVANDAYTLLGLTVGVYAPIGTRIYPINDTFVKDVSDLNYKFEINAEAVTFDGNLHKNLLANDNVLAILGASNTLRIALMGSLIICRISTS